MKHLPASFSTWKSGTFNPATLSLTGWWRNFANPTTPSASAGTSGSNGNMAPGVVPSFGSLNGHANATFNGTSQYMLTSATASSLYALSAGYFACLANVITAAATTGAVYADSSLMTSGSFYPSVYSSGGVGFYYVGLFDGAAYQVTTPLSFALGTTHLFQAWWDGVNLNAQVDSGASTSVACGPLGGFPGGGLTVGANNDLVHFTNVTIDDVMTASSVLASTARNNIRSYCNSRYGVSV